MTGSPLPAHSKGNSCSSHLSEVECESRPLSLTQSLCDDVLVERTTHFGFECSTFVKSWNVKILLRGRVKRHLAGKKSHLLITKPPLWKQPRHVPNLGNTAICTMGRVFITTQLMRKASPTFHGTGTQESSCRKENF